ncbi:hypothetical protein OKZ62_004335, partial [Vibrio navarrensis]|nr:hypothetical protein [Vibrio navarrensis]
MIKSNLHIITSLESGGAQKVLYDYLVETSSYNSNKQIVISLRGEGFYSKKINALGIDLIYLSTMRGVLSFVKLLIFSKGYIKCWMYHACLLSMFFCFLPYRRIYWSIHHGRIDLNSDSNSTIISAKICSIVSRFVPQKVIYVSKFCLQEHLKFGFSKSNAIVIYNWVPAYRSDLPKLEDRHYDFCFVGRDHPNKNLRMFLDSSIETVNNGNIRRFLIAGHGTERNMDYVLSHLN